MEDKIWQFAENVELEETPYEILDRYASKLKEDTEFIEGKVKELISESRQEVIYALYLVVPELKNYSYRLIEVVQPNAFTFYPVTVKLYGKADGNIITEQNVEHDDFEKLLKNFINSPITKGILQSLKVHIDIAKKYSI
jgi:hypothetical protein